MRNAPDLSIKSVPVAAGPATATIKDICESHARQGADLVCHSKPFKTKQACLFPSSFRKGASPNAWLRRSQVGRSQVVSRLASAISKQ
jgi:hypothetical protein